MRAYKRRLTVRLKDGVIRHMTVQPAKAQRWSGFEIIIRATAAAGVTTEEYAPSTFAADRTI